MRHIIALIIFLFLVVFLTTSISANKSAPKKLTQADVNPQSFSQNPDVSSCNFTRSDQGSNASIPFKSQKFLGYLYEASQKSSVPVGVLGGIARIESTTEEYSISDYTDQDIQYIEQSNVIRDIVLTPANASSEIAKIKDLRIPGTSKAVCPVSSNNALGIMQIQPPGTRGRAEASVEQGAQLIGKSASSLTLKDYCTPKSSLLMGAGFILSKQGVSKWDPSWNDNRTKIDAVARSYYGGLIYGDQDQYSYGGDLYSSLQGCKNPTFNGANTINATIDALSNPVTNTAPITQTVQSNTFITRVGNPAVSSSPAGVDLPSSGGQPPSEGTASGPLGFTITCPLGSDFKISCGTAENPVGNCGHGHPSLYQACVSPPYAACPGGRHSEPLRKSIDVVLKSTGNAADAPVYFPYFNGNQSVNWDLYSGPTAIASGAWGYKSVFVADFQGKEIRLDLTHINARVKSSGSSGEQVGTVYNGTDGPGGGHLHTLVYVDGRPVETAKEAFVCYSQ
jgi:hypothetical protein